MAYIPREPTYGEIESNAAIQQGDSFSAFALWFPQMGGYAGKAVAVIYETESDGCMNEVYVWHDGDFPFSDDQEQPRRIHYCDASQFVDFGNKLIGFEDILSGGEGQMKDNGE